MKNKANELWIDDWIPVFFFRTISFDNYFIFRKYQQTGD